MDKEAIEQALKNIARSGYSSGKNRCPVDDFEAWLDDKIKKVLSDLVDGELIIAFVQGAQWWEYESTKFTMWQSDRNKAELEAIKRVENKTLGKLRQIENATP